MRWGFNLVKSPSSVSPLATEQRREETDARDADADADAETEGDQTTPQQQQEQEEEEKEKEEIRRSSQWGHIL